MQKEEAKKRAEELRAVLRYHADKYYNQDAPEIDDYEYDGMMNELKRIEKDFPELVTQDSPTQKIIGEVSALFEPVRHEVQMGSLQDVFSEEEVLDFDRRVRAVLPAVLYYRKHRTKRGAAIDIVLGCITLVIVAIFTNIYLIFPAYIHLYGMNWDAIIDICNKVNPYITSIPTFVLFSVVPFNIISGSVIGFITMLLYKKISVPLKKMIMA